MSNNAALTPPDLLLERMMAGDEGALSVAKASLAQMAPETRASVFALLNLVREKSHKEGMREMREMLVAVPGTTIQATQVVCMVQNNDGQSGKGSNYLSYNSGQQQGVVIGSGDVTMRDSAQGVQPTQQGEGAFDSERFRTDLRELLDTIIERILALEADAASAGQILMSLRTANTSGVKTLEDMHQMLEDLWDSSMKEKYRGLQALVEQDAELASIVKGAKSLGQVMSLVLGR